LDTVAPGKGDENPIDDLVVEPLPRQEPPEKGSKGMSSSNPCMDGFPLRRAINFVGH
jgi:hypothetical protein